MSDVNFSNVYQYSGGLLIENNSDCYFGTHLTQYYPENIPTISDSQAYTITLNQEVPKISKNMWEAIVALFHDLTDRNLEVAVRIYINLMDDTLICVVPKQEVTGASYQAKYEQSKNILTGEDINVLDLVVQGYEQLWQIHSHNTMGLDHASNIDDGNDKEPNELYMPGGYAILSNFGFYKRPRHNRLAYVGGKYIQLQPTDSPFLGKDSYRVVFSIVTDFKKKRDISGRLTRVYVPDNCVDLYVQDLNHDAHKIYDRELLSPYHPSVLEQISLYIPPLPTYQGKQYQGQHKFNYPNQRNPQKYKGKNKKQKHLDPKYDYTYDIYDKYSLRTDLEYIIEIYGVLETLEMVKSLTNGDIKSTPDQLSITQQQYLPPAQELQEIEIEEDLDFDDVNEFDLY
jgi:hypothetical protein